MYTILFQSGLFEGIADGLSNAKLMLAFVSDEYADSRNCVMEFRFATSILKIPTVLAVVGTGLQWRASEVSLALIPHFNITNILLCVLHSVVKLLHQLLSHMSNKVLSGKFPAVSYFIGGS